jgi:SEC-C motif
MRALRLRPQGLAAHPGRSAHPSPRGRGGSGRQSAGTSDHNLDGGIPGLVLRGGVGEGDRNLAPPPRGPPGRPHRLQPPDRGADEAPRPRVAGHPMRVGPITVDGLSAFSTAERDDPGTAEARSSYAAEIARRGDAIRWPPGRNALCWCGSGRKYKTCCGPVPMGPE